MKYDINQLEAVRSFFNEKGFTGRIRFYNGGREVPKGQATEFSVPVNAPVFITNTGEQAMENEINIDEMDVAQLENLIEDIVNHEEVTDDVVDDEPMQVGKVDEEVEEETEEEVEEAVQADPSPETAPEPTVVEAKEKGPRKLPATRNGAQTKVDIVRNEIRARLASDTYDFEELVEWSQEKFTWTRQNARAYITKATARVKDEVKS